MASLIGLVSSIRTVIATIASTAGSADAGKIPHLDSNGFLSSSFLSSVEIDDGNSGSADTIDWSAGRFHKSTLTANCTYTFTSPGASRTAILQLLIVQDSTPRTITWPATVKWAGGAAPTLSTGSGAIDIATFRWNGTNYYGTFSKGFA